MRQASLQRWPIPAGLPMLKSAKTASEAMAKPATSCVESTANILGTGSVLPPTSSAALMLMS